ncbi:MAG: hypothetical protein ABJL18_01195 [Hyphomicrobiales bacterium]
MDIPIEDGSDERVSTSNAHETETDKPSKNTRSLTETMQLIRKKEHARRFATANVHGQNRNQLSLLLDDLEDVIADIGDERKYFDFHLSHGEQPQLWIDETTFVVMSKGGAGFRLLKQTRAGRILLRESRGRAEMGEAVVHYIAERLSHIENEQIHAQHVASSHDNKYAMPENKIPENSAPDNRMPDPAVMELEPTIIVRHSRLRSFFWFLTGFLTGALTLLALAWFRDDISAYLSTL